FALMQLLAQAGGMALGGGLGLAGRFQQLDGAQDFFFQGLEISIRGGGDGFDCIRGHRKTKPQENLISRAQYIAEVGVQNRGKHDCVAICRRRTRMCNVRGADGSKFADLCLRLCSYCARSTPPSDCSLAMICSDHCATSSSRSVRSLD